MIIRGQFLFRGPSLYARVPVVRMTVDTESVDALTPNPSSRSVAAQLVEVLPDLAPLLTTATPEDAGRPPSAEPSLADIVARTALVLQQEFGYTVKAAQALPAAQSGLIEVAYEYSDPVHGSQSGHAAVALANAAMAAPTAPASVDEGARLGEILKQRLSRMKERSLTKPTRWIVAEAARRGIPWFRIHHSQSSVQLGHGHKRRRFRGSYTSDTSYIATMLATSKVLVGDMYRASAIPVPRQFLVTDADAAVSASRKLGYPVVVKPNYWDMGIGVRINLTNEESVREAFANARTHGSVLVEQQIAGDDHRITLIHGRMVAAGREIPARVTGDGTSSVRELIAAENRDPRRGDKDYFVSKKIHVDDEILQTLDGQGYDLDSVPDAGAVVKLRLWWRHAEDHLAEDLTGVVHPDNQAVIERAARLIGLDVAGVDFITPDISRPWHEVGGAINEINPMPGMHTHVLAGKPDVVGMVVDTFFPEGDDGRIPSAVIAGQAGTSRTARLVAAMLDHAGHTVGLASAEGVEIGGARIAKGDYARPGGAHMVLSDPTISAAVLEASSDGVNSAGLGIDRAAVSAVINSGVDAGGAPSGELSASALSLLLEIADELVVLSADDPQSVKLAPFSRAKRLCWIAPDPEVAEVKQHIKAGGMAVGSVDVGGTATLALWDQSKVIPLAAVAELASEGGGKSAPVEAMFAAAVAYGLGVAPETISRTLVSAA